MISSVTVSKSLSGIGLGGIVTQQISAVIYADRTFNDGDKVTVVGFDGLPDFFIDGQNLAENSVSITAYDRCRKLSQPFDYSSLSGGADENGEEVYADISALALAEKVAAQCGFFGASNTAELFVGNVSADFYKGNSCNGIIENLASASGCFVCCDNSNKLRFQAIGSGYSSASAFENSKIITYPKKTISRLVISGDKSEIYDIGSGSAENILELSNSLMTKTMAENLASKILPFEYVPVSFNAVLTGNVDPYGMIAVGDDFYTVTNISVSLCADGAVANVSAPVLSGSSTAYNNLMSRQINQRISANRSYGNTKISGSAGLEFVDSDDNSYGFKTASGGVTEYDGAMMDKTMPVSVTTVSNTGENVEKRISYAGRSYSLKYKKSGGEMSEISLTEVTE